MDRQANLLEIIGALDTACCLAGSLDGGQQQRDEDADDDDDHQQLNQGEATTRSHYTGPLLLDSDVCPHCERGRITSDNLTCGKCGFTIDPRYVTWG